MQLAGVFTTIHYEFRQLFPENFDKYNRYIANETIIVSICIMYHTEDTDTTDFVIYFCRLQKRIGDILHRIIIRSEPFSRNSLVYIEQ